jgi:hypothetical protein
LGMFFGGRVVNLILHSKARFHDSHTNQGLLIGAPTRTAGDFIGGVSADPGATHKPKVMGSEVSGHGVSDSGVEPGIFSQNNAFNVPPRLQFSGNSPAVVPMDQAMCIHLYELLYQRQRFMDIIPSTLRAKIRTKQVESSIKLHHGITLVYAGIPFGAAHHSCTSNLEPNYCGMEPGSINPPRRQQLLHCNFIV